MVLLLIVFWTDTLSSAYFSEWFILFLTSPLDKTYFSYYQMTLQFFKQTGCTTKSNHMAEKPVKRSICFESIILMTEGGIIDSYRESLNFGLSEVKMKQPVDPSAAETSGGDLKSCSQ